MGTANDQIQIDYDVERLARDQALLGHAAHVLCLQGEMELRFSGEHFVLHKDEVLALPLQALLEEKKPSDDFQCLCVYISPEIMDVLFSPPPPTHTHTATIIKSQHGRLQLTSPCCTASCPSSKRPWCISARTR